MITLELNPAQLSDIIYAVKHFARDAESYCKMSPRAEDRERWAAHSLRFYALAQRLESDQI